MTKSSSTLEIVLQHVERAPLRSSLFHWLFEHHGKIIASLGRHRIEWTPLCEIFRAHGLTDATGKPPTERTARQTWYRVRREVERQQQLKADRRPAQQAERVRARQNWQPPAIRKAGIDQQHIQPKVVMEATTPGISMVSERPASLLIKPKTPEQLIAEVALKKPARERTPEERIAVLIAGQQDRSYS